MVGDPREQLEVVNFTRNCWLIITFSTCQCWVCWRLPRHLTRTYVGPLPYLTSIIHSQWIAQDHVHKPWTPTITADGVHYPTKDEAEYPKLLCARVAALLVADLKSKGIEQPDTFQQQIGERRTTAVNSVAMGLLPRGQKLRPLVSEFGHYVQFVIKPDMDATILLQSLVKGARITDRKLLTGGDMPVSGRVDASLQYLGLQEVPESMKVELVTIGIPREPWDFVQQAALVGHPRFLPYAGSPHLDTLLGANLGQNWRLGTTQTLFLQAMAG